MPPVLLLSSLLLLAAAVFLHSRAARLVLVCVAVVFLAVFGLEAAVAADCDGWDYGVYDRCGVLPPDIVGGMVVPLFLLSVLYVPAAPLAVLLAAVLEVRHRQRVTGVNG